MRLVLLCLIFMTVGSPQTPEFDAASIRRNTSQSERAGWERPPNSGRFTATDNSLEMLITAYKLKDFQISGGPSWLKSERYDVTAESPETQVSPERFRAMLRALLAERFKLVVHTETKEVAVYVLAPAKAGIKISAVTDVDCSQPQSEKLPCDGFYLGATGLGGRNISMSFFIEAHRNIVGRPVVDHTGFAGKFNVDIEFAPEGVASFGPGGFVQQGLSAGTDAENKPSIFTALQEKLGIQLESQRGPGEVLIIDHAERPSQN